MPFPLLAIDIGNSRVKAAFFSKKGESTPIWLPSPAAVLEWKDYPIAYVDTRGETAWRQVLSQVNAEELNISRKIPFNTAYTNRLGPDRIAQILAAWHVGEYPAVVISLGTACVIDFIDERGHHQGGVITAGIGLRLRALLEGAAYLPQVEPALSPPLLGKDTTEAIQAGVINGLGFELQGWLRALAAPPAKIWVCGGESEYLRSYFPSDTIFVPDLTLRGVWLWWHFIHEGSFPSY
ncbi:MAG: type III pantothenate kinase [Bacteroidia bacterium]|nr:type III pantothenate kinase [Bacteroidia bacterium]MDW8134739.1 type III pantothenate kinase [Bacteroidia bacterium]